MSYHKVEVTPVAGALGATISGVNLNKDLDDLVALDIEKALLEYQVIFFRNQDITPEVHKLLGSRFGALEKHPILPHLENHSEIVVLDSAASHPKVEEWHTDLTYEKHPPLGSILHCKIAPQKGGDTLWASMSAA